MTLLPIFEELRGFTIQVTVALKKTQTWTCNDHQILTTFRFSGPEIHSLIHFSSFH